MFDVGCAMCGGGQRPATLDLFLREEDVHLLAKSLASLLRVLVGFLGEGWFGGKKVAVD
jgi:hypothetical protein